MLPNPYLALAGVLGLALSGWAGYEHGRSVEAGDQALAQQSAIVAAHEAARADAAAESQRRQEAALRHARAAAAAREAKLKGQLHELKTAPRPECRWPAVRVGLLNDAISIANGTAPATSAVGLRGSLPAAPAAGD